MPKFLKGLRKRLVLSIAAVAMAAGLALGQATPAMADTTVVVVVVVVVDDHGNQNGYQLSSWDACQSRWGRDFYPWNNDNGCYNGRDYQDYSWAGYRNIGGGQIWCPGQYQDQWHGDTRFVADYRGQRVWNQQFGGLPPAPNLPPADYGYYGYPY